MTSSWITLDDGPWADPSADPWPLTSRFGPFDSMADVPAVEAGYQALATMVAQALDPAGLLPCAVDTPDPQGCAEALVSQLGRMVWRRPLTLDEAGALLAHYDEQDLVEGTRSPRGSSRPTAIWAISWSPSRPATRSPTCAPSSGGAARP